MLAELSRMMDELDCRGQDRFHLPQPARLVDARQCRSRLLATADTTVRSRRSWRDLHFPWPSSTRATRRCAPRALVLGRRCPDALHVLDTPGHAERDRFAGRSRCSLPGSSNSARKEPAAPRLRSGSALAFHRIEPDVNLASTTANDRDLADPGDALDLPCTPLVGDFVTSRSASSCPKGNRSTLARAIDAFGIEDADRESRKSRQACDGQIESISGSVCRDRWRSCSPDSRLARSDENASQNLSATEVQRALAAPELTTGREHRDRPANDHAPRGRACRDVEGIGASSCARPRATWCASPTCARVEDGQEE